MHDLRILAISLTPPEITYPVHGDGGLSCSPDPTAILATPTVSLRALVGDPAGNGRSLHYTFTGCPATGTEVCPDGGAYFIASGDSPAPELRAEWPLASELLLESTQSCAAHQSCRATPVLTAFEDDPLGLCRFGVWFQVGLEVDAPDGETLFGSSRMVFTPVPDDYPSDPSVCPQGPDGGPPAHTNPELAAYDLDGQALPLDSTPTVSAAVSHLLRPVAPSDGPQPYCLPNFSGGWSLLPETWLFSAVTDVGQLDREQVGGATPLGSDQTGPSTDLNVTWTFPDGGEGLTADLYEVTRDGRGGVSWITRHAAVAP